MPPVFPAARIASPTLYALNDLKRISPVKFELYAVTIETFFLCLFYERRIKTFQPSTCLSKRKIVLIRPLIFVREKTIAHLAAEFQLPVIANPCPANHHTKREEMKQLVASLDDQFPGVRDRMLTAFRTVKPECLWLK